MPGEELKRRLERGQVPLLVDVRARDELTSEIGHLPGIQHIPIGDLSRRLDELEAQKDQEIVTICKSGGRAHTAAQILMQAGFSNISVLEGGMAQWHHASYPIDRSWPSAIAPS